MSSVWGRNLTITVFGQSHAEAIGVVVDGLPAGVRIDTEELQAFMKRRAAGGAFATARVEADTPEFVSGLVDGVTCGAPVTALIRNTNVRSGDYSDLRDHPRPSHADYPASVRFDGANDIRGGGQFSGRLTAALCVAVLFLKSRFGNYAISQNERNSCRCAYCVDWEYTRRGIRSRECDGGGFCDRLIPRAR